MTQPKPWRMDRLGQHTLGGLSGEKADSLFFFLFAEKLLTFRSESVSSMMFLIQFGALEALI
jgi:hypothetical protein